MINSSTYNYINILDKAADAAYARNELLSNNIANVDTPDYKRQDLNFENLLEQSLAGSGTLSNRINSANENLEQLEPMAYTDNSTLSYRLDGNNVSIDTENAYLAENQIKYNALIEQMSQEFGRYKTVLTM